MKQIDKNIPVPEFRKGNTKFPFDKMEVGDSFLYHTETTQRRINNCNTLTCNYGKLHNKKFNYAKTDEGIRVWRTA